MTTIIDGNIKTETASGAGATTTPTVVRRARLGNSTEDISYSPHGTFAGRFIVLDGYTVLRPFE
jgi:hypothetical protein